MCSGAFKEPISLHLFNFIYFNLMVHGDHGESAALLWVKVLNAAHSTLCTLNVKHLHGETII